MAKVGHNPSLKWQSISASVDLIKDGMLWRINNGQDVNIWSDRWLPIPTSFQVQSLITVLSRNTKVEDPIDTTIGSWNRDVVYWIFMHEESNIICSIPISTLRAVNKISWWPT